MSKYHDPHLYKSRWRAAARVVLQRGIFRLVVTSVVTQHKIVHPEVKKLKDAFVLVANHSSHLDAPMLAQGLPLSQGRYITAGAGRDYWFESWKRRLFVRLLFNAFPIDRDGSRENSGISRKLLEAGVPVLVFPEGTRSKSGAMGRFKPGAASLAASIGVPIVPAALIGAHEAMPKGRNWPKPGRPPVGVVFGEPMRAAEGESAVSLIQRVQDAVTGLYRDHYGSVMGSEGNSQNPSAPAGDTPEIGERPAQASSVKSSADAFEPGAALDAEMPRSSRGAEGAPHSSDSTPEE